MSELSIFSIPITLASASPRRKELMEKAGFIVEVQPIEFEESYPLDLPAKEVALFIARKKAHAAKIAIQTEGVILTADSIVILDDLLFGKPQDKQEAGAMLRQLSDKEHQVVTGVCLIQGEKEKAFDSHTYVTLGRLTDTEIDYYIETWQPYDKAGAYGIQDWIGWCKVTSIRGSYANVMGLPVAQVYTVLTEGF